jgi:hypothetical protein
MQLTAVTEQVSIDNFDEQTFLCAGCHQNQPFAKGQDDEHFELCDDCWYDRQKSPSQQVEEMTWTELIDRLLAIQKARNYQSGWVIRMVMVAGHPPIQYWRRLAYMFGYPIQWPGRTWDKDKQTDQPDSSAIDWQKWEKPNVAPSNYKDIPKPIAKELIDRTSIQHPSCRNI